MNESSCFFLSVILQAEKQPHLLHNKQMKGTVCGEQAEWIHKAILLTVSLECSLKYILCFCIKNNKSLVNLTTIKWFLTGFTWSMVDSLPASGRAVNRCFHHGICLSANCFKFWCLHAAETEKLCTWHFCEMFSKNVSCFFTHHI